MSLVNMKQLLEQATKEKYGVGTFSISNMEMILGVVQAAEQTNAPVVMQVTQGRLDYSPLSMIGPMMLAAAKEAKVPIAVHLDHGRDINGIKEALQLGFTSVMIDASLFPLNENIRIVKEVIRYAEDYGASVEAEVGQIGGSEGWAKNDEVICSDPKDVKRLYEETGVNAIALSIGNTHGIYKSEPKLQFDILKQSAELVPVPLVLHGGSGISDEDFQKCIRLGIRKINIATASFMAAQEAAREYSKGDKNDFFSLGNMEIEAVKKNVMRHIRVFGSEGKAVV